MTTIGADDPLAVAAVEAIQTCDLPTLKRLLGEHPRFAKARRGGDDRDGMSRTRLHVVTDWPGRFGERRRDPRKLGTGIGTGLSEPSCT